MNISYNWLKRYLKTDLSAEEMATILTDIGLEVESFEKIESIRGGLAGVVVGEVLTCTDHPDSDHLHLTTVDVGGEAPLQIVCGAPNCRQGLKVLCATVGAVLYLTAARRSSRSSGARSGAWSRSACSVPRTNWVSELRMRALWSCRPTRKSASRPGSI